MNKPKPIAIKQTTLYSRKPSFRIKIANKDKPIAILTLHGSDKMTRGQKKKLANWLNRQAQALEHTGHNYASLFRARFYK